MNKENNVEILLDERELSLKYKSRSTVLQLVYVLLILSSSIKLLLNMGVESIITETCVILFIGCFNFIVDVKNGILENDLETNVTKNKILNTIIKLGVYVTLSIVIGFTVFKLLNIDKSIPESILLGVILFIMSEIRKYINIRKEKKINIEENE